MVKPFALVAAIVLLPLSNVACSSRDCVASCELANEECPTQHTDNCADDCAKWESLADRAGCSSQWDDAVDCKSDLDNICDGDAQCAGDLTGCLTPYCLTHQAECLDVM